MKTTKMLVVLVLVLASMVNGAQKLTVNDQDVNSISMKVGQSCTVKVVSTDSAAYEAYVGFDNGVVLGTFSHLQTTSKAGNWAVASEYDEPDFYGYYIKADGGWGGPYPSAGVHFIFKYETQQNGETELKLYNKTFTSVKDSVRIRIIETVGTAFTYQGWLIDANDVADGLYDFQFKLYDNPNVIIGNQVGNDVNKPEIDVIEGYFTVELDFGGVFDGDARWLQIGVRPGEMNDPNVYTILEPRQEVTPTPYALYAKTGNDWMVSGNDMYSIPSGKVGIGTATPLGELHVHGDPTGNIKISGKEQNYSSISMITNIESLDPGNWGTWKFWKFSAHGDKYTGKYNANELTMQYSAPGSGVEDVMLLQPGGNVGIGTINPNSKLEVNGRVHSTSGGFKFPDGTMQTSAATAGALVSVDGVSGDPSGDVDFIEGDNITITPNPAGNSITFSSPADGHSLDAADGSPIDAVYVDDDGRVGIWTSSPAVTLDVNGPVRGTRFQDRDDPNYYVDPAKEPIAAVLKGHVGIRGAPHSSADLHVNTGGDTARVWLGGNQTTTGAEVAHLSFIGNSTGLGVGQASYAGIAAEIVGSGGGMNPPKGALLFYTATGVPPMGSPYDEQMRITASGNVGIGTSSPLGELHVHGDPTGSIKISGNEQNYSSISMITNMESLDPGNWGTWKFWKFSAHGDKYTGGYKANELAVQYCAPGSGVEDVMLLQPGGNVGIGTIYPAYDLDVNGDIRARGSIYYGGSQGYTDGTAYTKPDYVFEEGYDVMSIEQVENYLAKENHLPWMTSVKQEKEENSDVIDMTRMAFETVETVENLQMQVIELNKQNKALEKRVAALEKMVLQQQLVSAKEVHNETH